MSNLDAILKNQKSNKKLQLAAASIFLEIARADNQFTNDERQTLIKSIKKLFKLNDEEVHELLDIAEDAVLHSVSIYEFTNVINQYLNEDEKYTLVKHIWHLIFADKDLNRYEDHLVRLVTNNLKLSHRDIIAAKQEVKQELGLN
ncbi:TerB family tellurite resistance protein [Melioribacter sp. OK-6-Me]|uniref:tellurite resistance TerB family protein n=1 Tax=unclassified Melioribacter TaxID=2627329 RepID=UPI003EDABF35